MKMKNKRFIFTTLSIPLLLTSCNTIKEGQMVFKSEDVVLSSYNGVGVEWGVYEDVSKLTPNYWERTKKLVDRLNPSIVRCMTNFDWIVKNYDNKNTDDVNDDSWEYDFKNKYMQNACDILDYCQQKKINVAFGVWNVIGNANESDEWKMIKNATSDIRWAKLSADLMEYLIKDKGYDCIKWFVSTNEPNWTGVKGQSKNAYNTYEKWETGVKNVRNAFDNIGLTNLDIIGGDTTGFVGSTEYLTKIATNLNNTIHNYGIHLYISNFDIDSGKLQENLSQLYDGVKEIDTSLGENKDLIIWESGLLDGKNVQTDCNAYIGNYSYGIRMADYTIQSALAKVNGVCYWDLDDAMHFMYSSGGMKAKEWGMYSTLNDASASKQEVRPWYHSSTLLSNLLKNNPKIYSPTMSENKSVRAMAVVTSDNKDGGIALVNRSTNTLEEEFAIKEKIESIDNKLYVYMFNESSARFDKDGFIIPSYVIDGSLNNKTKLKIAPQTLCVVSTKVL